MTVSDGFRVLVCHFEAVIGDFVPVCGGLGLASEGFVRG